MFISHPHHYLSNIYAPNLGICKTAPHEGLFEMAHFIGADSHSICAPFRNKRHHKSATNDKTEPGQATAVSIVVPFNSFQLCCKAAGTVGIFIVNETPRPSMPSCTVIWPSCMRTMAAALNNPRPLP